MPPKKNNNNNNKFNKQSSSSQDIQDPRFKRVHNDPRFLRAKKKDTKVVIDNRFKSMLKSKEFGSGSGPKVDKYGRRIQPDNAEKELKRFYHIEDEDEEASEEEKTLSDVEREIMADEGNLEDEISEEEEEEEEEEQVKEKKIKTPKLKFGQKGYDPMRGKGVIESSTEEDTSDEETDEEEESSEEEVEVPRIAIGEETRRLALVNMDWDKIKAMDLFQVLNGFKPKTGVIERVSIYPSEFGKQRMEIEEREGPPKDIFKTKLDNEKEKESEDEDLEEDDEEEVTEKTIIRDQLEEGGGEDFDQDALRKYQLDRLKYYYAVVECDSPFTAKIICQTCDGNEYESSANFFDIRYIPDDMTFDDEPRDTCTHVADNYKPVSFSTEALQHTKVKLTWDQDEPERIELTRRDFTEQDLKDLDFEAYLASSSSEDDDSENDDDNIEAIRAKYRKLLQETDDNVYDDKTNGHGGDDNDDDGDMEITFTPGLSELAAAKINGKQEDDDNEKEEVKEETTIEKYMRKQKEKRLAKKERRESKWKEEDISDNKKKNNKKNNVEEDYGESDMDEELEEDDFFKEARQEMEQELSLDNKKVENDKTADKKDKKKKNKKKKLTKEERLEQKRQRAELELLMDDQGKGDGFDMKEIMKLEKLEKKKGKKSRREKELLESTTDDFEINVDDPRFAAVQDSHHFAIDPTNPQFKKTKNMKKLLEARQSKLKQNTDQADDWKKETNSKAVNNTQKDEKKLKDSSLSQLVDSVKRKGAISQPKIGKRQKV